MAVHSLSTLSMGSITTNLWRVQDPTPCLVGYYWFARDHEQKEMYEDFKNILMKRIKDKINSITNQLLEINYIPEYTSVMISRAFIYLVAEMRDWAKTLSIALQDIDDLSYCLQKSVFTSTGRLDRPKSVTKFIYDSFGMIHIDCTKIACNTAIIPKQLESYLFRTLGCTSQYKQNVVSKTYRLLKRLDISYVANEEHVSTWFKYHYTIRGNVQVLDFWYNLEKEEQKTEWLCNVLQCIGPNRYNFKSDKIIYVYHHVDSEKWIELLLVHYLGIITHLYMNGQSEYCLLFYKQIMRWKPDACRKILETLFSSTDTPSKGVGYKIYNKCRKYTFQSMWNCTDANILASIYNTHIFHSICAYWLDKEYELVRGLITEMVHSDETRTNLCNYLAVYNWSKMPKNYEVYLDKLYEDFKLKIPKDSKKDYKPQSEFNGCKQILPPIESSHGNIVNHDTIALKRKKKVIKLLINTINELGFDRKTFLTSLNSLIRSIFPNRDDALLFITQHLLKTNKMIEIYCTYLYARRKSLTTAKALNIHILNGVFDNKTVASKIRQTINKTNFIQKTVKYINKTIGYYKVTPIYLKYICDKKEKKAIIKTYLYSEEGLKDVITKFIGSEGSHLPIDTCAKECWRLNKYWLNSSKLRKQFADYISANSRDVYGKYFSAPIDQYKKTEVNDRYKLFMHFLIRFDYMSTVYHNKQVIVKDLVRNLDNDGFTLID